MSPKKPRTGAHVGRGDRQPRTGAVAPAGTGGQKVLFSFEFADRHYSGEWSWPKGDDLSTMVGFLCEMSALTWNEVERQQTGPAARRRPRHHSMPFDRVCKEAQERLAQLRHDETFDEFFRFRTSGAGRLWGFRLGQVFYVLWWDEAHRVYPTDPN